MTTHSQAEIDVQPLPGWVSVAKAAVLLSTTKQSVYYRMFTQRQFSKVYKIESSDDGKRTIYVLPEDEVKDIAAEEKAQGEQLAAKQQRQKLINERNKRIKTWGRESGWQGIIHPSGAPSRELCDAYALAHPEDVPAE